MTAVRGRVRACRLADTYSHTRFHLALRTKTQPSTYHRLLLFRVNNVYDTNNPEADISDSKEAVEKEAPCPTLATVQNPGSDKPELYCMEETCPHLGAPLSHAEIEIDDIEDTRAVGELEDEFHRADLPVCPWHQYDFATGLKTCTYNVEVIGKGDDAEVWVDAPHNDGGHEWEVVEFRGVSEEFADPPIPSLKDLNLGDGPIPSTVPGQPQLELPSELPTSLLGFAHLVLATADPDLKCILTKEGVQRMRAGKLKSIRPTKGEIKRIRETVGLLDEPPRFATIVPPNKRGKLGRGGTEKSRIKMLHALANIEQYAIDLAWDIIARFAEFEIEGERLPVEYFLDWAKVAEDEAKHFSLLNKRLREMGSYFGSQTVHAGLWKSAMETADSLLSRIAIIHLVAEARGVDMNPLR
ncbi:hypothetical protein A1Q1_08110 [Trichosporon asahii var. asahii CBS 2479]|uniref:Rieske domain-containing protein n=1 Tax=Trichosporon asahii var. asahii (strain ATCC 90039 / CBS 2479 / JCM 2466 / KCTC 7840 / NBRC 103889/ NCYC 2677 / UAMH 7654) TaxID=1186058 RepID=J6F623_TRIAS|nr:hypothetical protein A1Q1_08110 [Trichosporon asahii var. asahii CBS 2479]EJT50762.1 hypothetical protein A1Q1_08110 [Trichosporon asahii var. asahii CBS 2479]